MSTASRMRRRKAAAVMNTRIDNAIVPCSGTNQDEPRWRKP